MKLTCWNTLREIGQEKETVGTLRAVGRTGSITLVMFKMMTMVKRMMMMKVVVMVKMVMVIIVTWEQLL